MKNKQGEQKRGKKTRIKFVKTSAIVVTLGRKHLIENV